MIGLLFEFILLLVCARAAPVLSYGDGSPISSVIFESLEELARIVDISYCVGSTGIQKPFRCLSRCSDFEGFELVTTWNTGPLLSDSCGYIALSHGPYEKRVLVVFRGTYSIANTIADLSTRHAEYAPYPPSNGSDGLCAQTRLITQNEKQSDHENKCQNCTIHSGFLTSWRNTRCTIISAVEKALKDHPDYKLVLVGHSLGGAVAAVAALEFQARGYNPHVVTFGQPRVGNRELNDYIDQKFNLDNSEPSTSMYWRVTHVDDPVPLLPPEEWGYEMHAGEIFISKAALPPRRSDLRACLGDADPHCIAQGADVEGQTPAQVIQDTNGVSGLAWDISIPEKYRLWQLFFAHRDYFWRLGLCVPGPWDWRKGSQIVAGGDEL